MMDASLAPLADPAAPPFSGIIMTTHVHPESMDPKDNVIHTLLVNDLPVDAVHLPINTVLVVHWEEETNIQLLHNN